MTSPPVEQAPGDQALGQGAERCRNMALQTAVRFMERLVAASGLAPLTADDVRREFAVFCRTEDVEMAGQYNESHERCRRAAGGGQRRLHAFERAVIARFDKRFQAPTAEGHQLSRRVILGFMYALTKALGPESFRRHDIRARTIAHVVRDGDPTADSRMHEVVNAALVEMAEAFHGEFLVALKEFTDIVNSRLSVATPGAWDMDWELNRPLAVLILDDLFEEVRAQFEAQALPPAYGPDAAPTLARFFAGLDAARKLADRPWLKRQLTP